MSRELGRRFVKLAIAAVIAGIGTLIPYYSNMTDYQANFITLIATGFLAGLVSGERLSILVAPLVVWALDIAYAWLHPSPYSDALEQILPWNILFTEDGMLNLVTVLVPLGFFAFLGWLCRASLTWIRDGNRRPLGEVLRDALRASPKPLALLLDLVALLTVPVIPFAAVLVCIGLLIAGSVLILRSPQRDNKLSGAILSLGGVVMIPALAVVFRSFFGL